VQVTAAVGHNILIAACSEVEPHRYGSRRITAIDFLLNVEYVLLITDNPTGKRKEKRHGKP
jgi:hypothetical protein